MNLTYIEAPPHIQGPVELLLIFLLLGFCWILATSIVFHTSLGWLSSLVLLLANGLFLKALGMKEGFICTQIPVWLIYLVPILELGLFIYMVWRTKHYVDTHVTGITLKQGMDRLPIGICVYSKEGIVLMRNYTMNNLCKTLTGASLMNGRDLWMDLCEKSGKDPETMAEALVVHLEDDTVWSVRKMEDEDGMIHLNAVDCTEQYNYNMQLEWNNQRLHSMNAKLRAYGDRVDEVVRQEENLAAKISIHDKLGRTLLSARRHLAMDAGSYPEDLITEWKQTMTMLMTGQFEEDTAETTMNELRKAAEFLNMHMVIAGQIPKSPHLQHLLISGARECLTNASKHAGADTLFIHIEYSPGNVQFRFTNNGTQPDPEEPIREGGGLSSLRKLVERENAQLLITGKPRFIVLITIYTELT